MFKPHIFFGTGWWRVHRDESNTFKKLNPLERFRLQRAYNHVAVLNKSYEALCMRDAHYQRVNAAKLARWAANPYPCVVFDETSDLKVVRMGASSQGKTQVITTKEQQ